jgi:hypothetical protein
MVRKRRTKTKNESWVVKDRPVRMGILSKNFLKARIILLETGRPSIFRPRAVFIYL